MGGDMIKELIIISLLFSVVISGCIQVPEKPTTITIVNKSVAEEQATTILEQEMEQAIENITMEDIEDALLIQ
jgi:hypothetical protein